MRKFSSADKETISEAVEKYADTVLRISSMYLKNRSDVDDVFQEVFLKFLLNYDSFENEEHEKAWICRVTFNKCKDLCKSFWRLKVDSIEEMEIPDETPGESELLAAVSQLPAKYKQVIYLHYYEGYTVPKIASILKQNENTVYTLLRRAKERLKDKLKEDIDDE